MATLVYTDATITVNSVNLSDHCRQITLTYEAEMLDDTVMGTSGTRSAKPGLKNWNMDCEFLQDFAAANVDATLFPLVGAASFPVAVKPTSGAISSTNPEYGGNAVLESYTPIQGEVGTLATTPATFRAGGGASNVLVRDVTP